jgi:anti-sigma B factor antagonist
MHAAGPARGVPGAEGRYRGSPSLQYRETTLADGTVVVSLGGDLDLDTSATLKQRLLHLIRRTSREVVVDMADLAFLDSFGLSALIAAWREADLAGVGFALSSLPNQARRVLEITNTAPLFRIVELHRLGGTERVSEDASRSPE